MGKSIENITVGESFITSPFNNNFWKKSRNEGNNSNCYDKN